MDPIHLNGYPAIIGTLLPGQTGSWLGARLHFRGYVSRTIRMSCQADCERHSNATRTRRQTPSNLGSLSARLGHTASRSRLVIWVKTNSQDLPQDLALDSIYQGSGSSAYFEPTAIFGVSRIGCKDCHHLGRGSFLMFEEKPKKKDQTLG